MEQEAEKAQALVGKKMLGENTKTKPILFKIRILNLYFKFLSYVIVLKIIKCFCRGDPQKNADHYLETRKHSVGWVLPACRLYPVLSLAGVGRMSSHP